MQDEQTVDVAAIIDQGRLGALQISILFWLCLLMAFEGYDLQAMAYAAPAILAEWHVSKASFGPVLSASLLGYLIGALCFSPLGDAAGRKKIVVAGALILSLFTTATILATNLGGLLALRLLAGIGLGGAMPAAVALAAEFVPKRHCSVTIGLTLAALSLGGAVGGFLAGWSTPVLGWRSVFYIGGLAPLPVCLALALTLPESVRFLALKGGRGRELAASMRRLKPRLYFADDVRFVAAAEAACGSPIASLFEDGRMRVTLVLWFAFATSFTGNYFLLSWLPTLMSDAGLSLQQANIVGGMFQAGGAAGSLIVGKLIDQLGFGIVGIVFFIGGTLVLGLGAVTAAGVVLTGLVFTAGLCVLGGQVGLIATANIIYPTASRATGTGWGIAVGRIGSIIGPVVGGQLMTDGFSRPALFAMAAAPAFVSAVALMVLLAVHRRGAGIALRVGA